MTSSRSLWLALLLCPALLNAAPRDPGTGLPAIRVPASSRGKGLEPSKASRSSGPALTGAAPVLWDTYHGSNSLYVPSDRYSSLISQLTANNYAVTVSSAGVLSTNLSGYEILVVSALSSANNSSYTAAEVSAIKSYVEGGGALLLLCDNTNTPNVNVNPVAAAFGVTCGVSTVDPADTYITSFVSHPIFSGITQIYMRAAGQIKATSPSAVVASYNNLGLVTAGEPVSGRVVVLGDVNIFDNTYITYANNKPFVLTTFSWLLGASSDADADGYTVATGDCDDHNAAIHPGAAELCDGIDNNCNSQIDENATDAKTWYTDADKDGYGNASSPVKACTQPTGAVAAAGDCNDANSAVNPGATELCNGMDDNCDGSIDDSSAANASSWYADTDNDGYGDPQSSLKACLVPTGYVASNDDCDDDDPQVNPGATELCNEIDDDCDGLIDDPSAADAPSWYVDTDGDGYGATGTSKVSCTQPAGYVAASGDCDDTAASIHPGATEYCNGFDDNCNGVTDEASAANAKTWYADADGDGYGAAGSSKPGCTQPTGYVADKTDCDDTRSTVYPGATELCNGLDDNCNGVVDEASAADVKTWYVDADGDDYGSSQAKITACNRPEGYAGNADDCNDADPEVYPEATERCDGIDNDCDGLIDELNADGSAPADSPTWYTDSDKDGYGVEPSIVSCQAPAGYVATDGDCDDTDPRYHPGADESDCTDSHDYNCDGSSSYVDEDHDGSPACQDCNDADPASYPGAVEVCDTADNDCDGTVDEGTSCHDDDGDGFTEEGNDCNDADASIHPGADEVSDGVDNDCDGQIDEEDTPAGDDDATSGDDDATSGDDDATSGDDDATSGDDDATSGDDDATSGDDDATSDGDDDATSGGDDDATEHGDDDATGGGDDDATSGGDGGSGCSCSTNGPASGSSPLAGGTLLAGVLLAHFFRRRRAGG